MTLFGYRAALELVKLEVEMQLERALDLKELAEKGDPYNEVLHIPLLLAGVGLGKTSILREIEVELAQPLIKINCGENGDPSDVSGIPNIFALKDRKGGHDKAYTEWVLNRALHRACEEPVVLAFDDIDKAPPLVEGALIGIFGERKVRDRYLHSGTVVLAAGNRAGDDILARELSESIRTRATTILMEPRFDDFEIYGRANPDKVHPVILGFLAYKPTLLHAHNPDAYRFPTPRSWCEVTPYLYKFEDRQKLDSGHNAWSTLIELKCGEAASRDFTAWYEIVRRVDVPKILAEGVLEHSLNQSDVSMVDYAAVFALSNYINLHSLTTKDKGLTKYLKGLRPEHRVALLSQLSTQAKQKTAKVLPDTADVLLSDMIPVAGSTTP